MLAMPNGQEIQDPYHQTVTSVRGAVRLRRMKFKSFVVGVGNGGTNAPRNQVDVMSLLRRRIFVCGELSW